MNDLIHLFLKFNIIWVKRAVFCIIQDFHLLGIY